MRRDKCYNRNVRNIQIKKGKTKSNYRLSVIISLGVLILLICGVGIITSMAKENETKEYKYFKSIVVEEGDTLWSIAQDYMGDDYDSVQDYIAEVENINAISGEKIRHGNSIVIPYYSNKLQ